LELDSVRLHREQGRCSASRVLVMALVAYPRIRRRGAGVQDRHTTSPSSRLAKPAAKLTTRDVEPKARPNRLNPCQTWFGGAVRDVDDTNRSDAAGISVAS
jgi:hypothetical protein